MTAARTDVVIFGGGVAGLWLHNRLRSQGYSAVLLEAGALGEGQTRYSQGIIHGGTKYALTGKLTGSSEAIAAMPALWQSCLNGQGEIDLRDVALLSRNQFLWSTASLTSRMAGFFASKLMRSRTTVVEGDARPKIFHNDRFSGQVYQLNEPVLDTASLTQALAAPHREAIGALGGPVQLQRHEDRWRVTLDDGTQLDAARIVLAAGKGNGGLLQQLGMPLPKMQLRPLNMVMVRGSDERPLVGELFAHCLGASANPRITITSHRDHEGRLVWYLGGEVAEQGVGRSDAEQVAAAKAQLQELFPWADFEHCEWGTLPIDRAEVDTGDGSRPSDTFVEQHEGVLTAWPTKLALAPRMAQQVVDQLPPPGQSDPLPSLRHPGFAPLPWQQKENWLKTL